MATPEEIQAANAAVWASEAERRVADHERLAPWKPAPIPSSYPRCAGFSEDPATIERMRRHTGYTQPCSGPVRWEVDGLDFCDKHLCQSGR